MGKVYVSAEQLTAFGWRDDSTLADLNAALEQYDITTPSRIAHFISQCGHESGMGRWTKELADGTAYETRTDLGNTPEIDGDGPRYRGAGFIQLTGRSNYQRFANYIGDPRVMEGVDYVAAEYPWMSAGFWWMNNGMNRLVDSGATVEQITYRVNGGYNGLSERRRLYERWINQRQREDAEMQEAIEALMQQNAQLQSTMQALANRLADLEHLAQLPAIPDWAQDAVESAVAKGLVDSPEGGSFDFYRFVTILKRKGII
ncbi:endopeptidase [Gorillibacterium sp. sgz5001074]|uniref:glycoside hydrolase family 19 protein n=1 Tax=Gorillibacterium sp. sgz5001074 TaxID=3446695 RepID=UPI003F6745E7